jgi:hypothetical protein
VGKTDDRAVPVRALRRDPDTYLTVRRLLADSLGTDPSAELRDLYSLVLSADNDVARTVPHQLPPAHPHFTGRTANWPQSTQWPTDPTGPAAGDRGCTRPGRCGKTALALHWAHRACARFPDAACTWT